MKIRLGIIAIVLFGMNLVSCSKSDLAEENGLIELATEGEKEKPDDKPEN